MSLNTEIIGYIAIILVSLNLFPQIYVIIKTTSATSVSYLTYVLNVISSLLLIYYSYCLDLIPILLGNIMILLTSITIICLKYKYS
jgi:uncharacterized protein with PQ loop repeat